ncbi:CoA transferase [Candidatus Bathyarchaeota archaeon]|nr:MAG: CoA transferase [Candidatus Bathyarchaeota archaeon]
MQPLTGLRVLDLTREFPSYPTILADFGAEVIKVEEPSSGDPGRYAPPLVDGESVFFLTHQRNKKSIGLNLKSKEGLEIFYKLVKISDVVIENFRPGVTKRLHIDYDAVKNYNPRIIYCSISGFGHDSPYSSMPSHDLNYQAMSSILWLTKVDDKIALPAVNLSAMTTYLYVTIAILIALINREKTGEGQYIDMSFLDSTVSLLSLPASLTFFGFDINNLPVRKLPYYGIFKTKDGRYICLGILYEEHFWRKFCKMFGREDLAKHLIPSKEKSVEIKQFLKELFKTKSRDEWFKILRNAGIPCSPVYSIEEVFQDPHVKHRGLILEVEHPKLGKIKQLNVPIKFSSIKAKVNLPPPKLGQHTDEILHFLGYSRDEIRKLREKNVIS